MEKQQYPANAVKHGEILIQCLIKIPRSRDRGHGITQMLIVKYRWLTSYLPILGSLAHHCKQYHVYRLCDKQKIMVGAGCSPSGRYPSPLWKFPSMPVFSWNLRGFQNHSGDCAVFSERLQRVSSGPVESSLGKSHLNWDVLERRWKPPGFRADLSLFGFPHYSAVVFPQYLSSAGYW